MDVASSFGQFPEQSSSLIKDSQGWKGLVISDSSSVFVSLFGEVPWEENGQPPHCASHASNTAGAQREVD